MGALMIPETSQRILSTALGMPCSRDNKPDIEYVEESWGFYIRASNEKHSIAFVLGCAGQISRVTFHKSAGQAISETVQPSGELRSMWIPYDENGKPHGTPEIFRTVNPEITGREIRRRSADIFPRTWRLLGLIR
ncbi:MAG TPA: hypothetical protein VFR09_05770 [Alphaproteobacteria bacterium]|nr:hypothetical protein [Alphaproteobacteria bacterium]